MIKNNNHTPKKYGLLLAAVVLCGCGQKGALYLPEVAPSPIPPSSQQSTAEDSDAADESNAPNDFDEADEKPARPATQ